MRLATTSWGCGPRTAVLVHGFSDDAQTWWRVGPALAELGWTVVAPDLRGHGRSARCADYALEDFAYDLANTLPLGADLVLGHSLGAAALGLAAPQLRARRTVFVDPPWLLGPAALDLSRKAEQPVHTWSAEDLAVDLASNALLDPRVELALTRVLGAGPLQPPPAPEPGSVVLVPELDPVLAVAAQPAVAALGYVVRTQPGVRHVMHRDDPAGFLALLREQLVGDELVA